MEPGASCSLQSAAKRYNPKPSCYYSRATLPQKALKQFTGRYCHALLGLWFIWERAIPYNLGRSYLAVAVGGSVLVSCLPVRWRLLHPRFSMLVVALIGGWGPLLNILPKPSESCTSQKKGNGHAFNHNIPDLNCVTL